jgi:hypothetical protein
MDRNAPVRLIEAGPWVYSGTTGIALLLVELYRLVGEPRFLETAIGALAGPTTDVSSTNGAASFFSGNIGLLAAYYRLYLAVGDPKYRRLAEDLVPREVPAGDGQDLIAGAAGGIPVLLEFGKDAGCETAIYVAVELGNDLLAKARSSREGLSWGDPGNSFQARNLCGLAHGASGIAVALCSIYEVTGDPHFRSAAEHAFAYEDSFFSESSGNWPDFRSSAYNTIFELRDYKKVSAYLSKLDYASLAYREKFMYAWCHGAPGILLARAHAASRGIWHGEEATLQRAAASLVMRLRSPELEENHSLCHGALGNIECAVTALSVLSPRHLQGALPEWANNGVPTNIDSFRTGTADGGSDPSLMMGEAGIAYALARLSGAKLPSLLIPSLRNSTVIAQGVDEAVAFAPIRVDRQVSRKEDGGSVAKPSACVEHPSGSPIGDNTQDSTDISFEEFKRRYLAQYIDRSLAGIRDLVPPPNLPLSIFSYVRRSVFVLPVTLLEECTVGPMESVVAYPSDRERMYVGFVRNGSPQLMEIGVLATLALQAIGEGLSTVEEVLERARSLTGLPGTEIDAAIVLQVYELIRVKLVDQVFSGMNE